ncbi:8-amino-7-oxononanoate synthase [Schinkia azotoformans MEV2011]|uniref:8-amino-7-ketopelargonate synthase n=1 Tax=Schinkia azotoformans MEV2011 TaxID=1348973 RepID=A0A072NIT4_SCHAZ|nr:8-amino-7-oxononanoate synthase [Schinkia azotoformans]KEF36813.1 8-amino-7-oxononanoate synthase [Schinkia azotoformans MEV2011]MEC1698168.1 8-amino-7-oxononanoate synthase [Schinkia azotoformans]MEC1725239.1 8-amino-7-oxononanoate synthase [Schinkia azotoformans]MEC1772744.1 8-amino-7-oxononanoate synthase [Schinkia azotoformans]MEC1777959.1 8-amino-7-oxononanoate synthase [Schinkia azotoformans]
MQQTWEDDIKKELEKLEHLSQNRVLQKTENAQLPWLYLNGQSMLNLASNNYLGLAGDSRLLKAAAEALYMCGTGATASRLIVGNHPLYGEAEASLIDWKGMESGMILNSGYTANIGIISALMDRNGTIFSDKYNHASIVDGIVLSRSKFQRYRHCDLNHLEALLRKYPTDKRKLIITDAVFSMDGDIAPLEGLVFLKERYNAILMVDEAHSSGIFGGQGEGLVCAHQLQNRVDIQMGTFSKGLGSYGAYIVGSKWLISYLMNKMRSFIFTTALPPSVLGSISAAIKIVRTEQYRRKQLMEHSHYFASSLKRLGFLIGPSETQIIPVIIGSNEQTMLFSRKLQEEGIAAIAVRPPTVPEGQARIRFTVMATHKRNDLKQAIEKIAQVGRKLGVIE